MPRNHIEKQLIVIFGGTGDLMRRKLLPALYHQTREGYLPDECTVLGVAHSDELNDESYRKIAREALSESGFQNNELASWCDKRLLYQSIGHETAKDFRVLADRITEVERKAGLPGNRVFYLAMPPAGFPTTISALGESGLNHSAGWTRLVVEKPFGRDLASAQNLNVLIHKYFNEEQIYRIDHYLGKETVQNLLAFRFGNAIFESIWNRDRVEKVTITVAEEFGIEQRGKYYEQAGVVRDMIQNHITQLLTLTAMEVPAAFQAEAIRHEKVKVLRCISVLGADDVVFGQYEKGSIDGEDVPAYRDEPNVSPESHTPTFVALRLEIDNWRWQGVPFYLHTGKRLLQRVSEIEVTFRHPPVSIFKSNNSSPVHPNILKILLQPDEGFELSFEVKAPGQAITLQTQRMHFRYAEVFGPLADAYETLLLDVMTGDQTLFVHSEEVEASWRLCAPLLDQRFTVYPYAAGTWGPPQAEALLNLRNGP